MDDNINALQCSLKTVFITNITEEVTQRRILAPAEGLFHIELLQLIARKYHQPFYLRIASQNSLDEGFTE